jgi:hypothetical protein
MISGALNIVEIFRRVCIILPNNTKLYIDDTLYSSKSVNICLVLKISAAMDITLRRYKKIMLNIFA